MIPLTGQEKKHFENNLKSMYPLANDGGICLEPLPCTSIGQNFFPRKCNKSCNMARCYPNISQVLISKAHLSFKISALKLNSDIPKVESNIYQITLCI